MAFLSGSVSFSRFEVVGGSPKRLDEQLIDKLRSQAIGKQRVHRPDHVEVGWVGGRHLLDRHFDVEKNVILECLHFGFRIDSANPPPDLLRAYIEMELESLVKENGNGHGGGNGNGNGHGRFFGRLKKEAREAATRRVEQEIKEGRYRRQRQFPILWDTRNNVVYVGATQPAVLEQLYPLFKESFGKRLEPLTAGRMSWASAERLGMSRPMEAMRPSRFVKHPDGNGHGEVHWTAHDAESRDYLGNEFLMWLWYTLSEETDTISLSDETDAAVLIVKQMTLECPWAESGKETISSDAPARLPESRRAIQTGKLPRKVGLLVSRQGEQYELSLQAETLNVSGGRLPKSEENGDGQGRVRAEERVEQVRHLSATIDLLFETFLRRRLAAGWAGELNKITKWLGSS